MKDPSDKIREWLHYKLSDLTYEGSAVSVYSIPPAKAVMPYVVIGEQTSAGEDKVRDAYITIHDVTIEIWFQYSSNATYKGVNTVANSILEKVRAITPTTYIGGENIDDWNAITVTMSSMLTDKFLNDKGIVVYKSLNINFLMEEL
jgi:hypothetical protein